MSLALPEMATVCDPDRGWYAATEDSPSVSQALAYRSTYFSHRRDLFGVGSEALFASARGVRERLPIRSIANIIQAQIANAGLTGRITSADLGRYGAAKLIAEGVAPHDALLMIGYKRIPMPARGNELDPISCERSTRCTCDGFGYRLRYRIRHFIQTAPPAAPPLSCQPRQLKRIPSGRRPIELHH